jgi:hypothetical protein
VLFKFTRHAFRYLWPSTNVPGTIGRITHTTYQARGSPRTLRAFCFNGRRRDDNAHNDGSIDFEQVVHIHFTCPGILSTHEERLERLDQGNQRGLDLYFLGNSAGKPDAPRRAQSENGTQETGMENNLQCSAIRQKTARLAAVLQKVEAFAAAGGDLKSPAAFLDGWELVDAFAELAEEFEYEILISINDRAVKPGGLFRVSVAGRS